MSDKKEKKSCWDTMPAPPPPDPKKTRWQRFAEACGTAIGNWFSNPNR
jgi:hypothetical protein